MKLINGYFRWVTVLAMLLAISAPFIQIGAELFVRVQTGAAASFDLYALFPEESALIVERFSGTNFGIALDLLCDMWVWVPAVLVLSLIGILHRTLAGMTGRK